MITVKMLLPLLKGAKAIYLDWNGMLRKIDLEDALDMNAYGDYVIDRIGNTCNTEEYELRIAFIPMKAVKE